MKKLLLALAVPVIAVGIASANPAPKVFVCKYVGTPNVDERLQTGQNPISVSSNAIKNYTGVGSYFNDAQGRSYVLAVDVGQPEPSVTTCPAPQVPPVVTPPVTPPTTTPTTTPPSSTPAANPAATTTPAPQPINETLTPFEGK